MEISSKCLYLLLLVFLTMVAQTQAKPLQESAISENTGEEMMHTADSQNPFLPRFAMKRLKEKRLRAQAQRRSNPAMKKFQPPQKDNCTKKSNIRRWYYIHRK